MKFTEEDILLRIFVSETEHFQNKPLYESIVYKAKELKLAGATVFRGLMGFGADSHVHSAKIMDLSENLPMVIEIVDKEENIQKILPLLDEMIHNGFITMERVNVVKYRTKNPH